MTDSQEDLFPDSETGEINEAELIRKILLEDEANASAKDGDKDSEEAGEKANSEKSTKFPVARIKSIMKMDPDVSIVSHEAVLLVTKATELFLENLAKETYKNTMKAKRKLIQKKDVETAVENIDSLCFLEGALD